jgi:glyoxylase-like metal-dependent hydrolase (beta-lactamase superfamily II)
MLNVKRLSLGMLNSNCYLVYSKNNCLIIDPADEADYISRIIEDLELNPIAIVATHGHFDHTIASLEIKINYDIPFMASKLDSFLLERQKDTVKHFQNIKALPAPKIDRDLNKTDEVKLNDTSFSILKTPGHTPGSVSFYSKKEEIVFTGDLIFKDGIGRYDFSYANKKALKKSIKAISNLPKNTVIYPGHGEPTSIRKELKNINNYLSLL